MNTTDTQGDSSLDDSTLNPIPVISEPSTRLPSGGEPAGADIFEQSLFKAFSRSQVASLVATAVDYSTTAMLVELASVWYVSATALGAFLGAVTNFLMNRHWSFQVAHLSMRGQAGKYFLVSAGSLGLNTALVYFLTDGLGFKYMISKVVASLGVGIFYNFPLHRWFVFK